jgi:bifunctional non-homologous end joining protein LigD
MARMANRNKMPRSTKAENPCTRRCKPELVCEVRFTAWTDSHLRHPIFLGMREDKPARMVRCEMSVKEKATRPP